MRINMLRRTSAAAAYPVNVEHHNATTATTIKIDLVPNLGHGRHCTVNLRELQNN